MNIQEEIRKQIVQELKINQTSQCPNVVVCYHSFYHNGAISLVLEYMDRGSLVDVIRQVKTILEPYLAVVCKQVCQFLNYIYSFIIENHTYLGSPVFLIQYCKFRFCKALFTCIMIDT